MKGVPPPAAWAEEPYRPHEVASLLDQAGLRASYFHDLDHWQIFDPEAAFGVQLMRGPDDYPAMGTRRARCGRSCIGTMRARACASPIAARSG